jgi:hypothetical protein
MIETIRWFLRIAVKPGTSATSVLREKGRLRHDIRAWLFSECG